MSDGVVLNPSDPFEGLLIDIVAIRRAKGKDYGGPSSLDNFDESKRIGVTPDTGIVVRMSDKWARLCNLYLSHKCEVINETVEDTLKDLAVYALLCIVVRHRLAAEKEAV